MGENAVHWLFGHLPLLCSSEGNTGEPIEPLSFEDVRTDQTYNMLPGGAVTWNLWSEP